MNKSSVIIRLKQSQIKQVHSKQTISETAYKKMTTKSRFLIRLILPVALLLFANYVLHSFIHYGAEFQLNKLVRFNNEFQIGLFKTVFIGMPLLGFILGLLFSFIPYKKLGYWKKYLIATLLSLVLLQSIYFILGIAGQIIN